MKKIRVRLIPVSLLILALAACNLPQAGAPNGNQSATAAAQTVAALLQITPTVTDTPAFTDTATPATATATNTLAPATLAAASDTPIPFPTQVCDSGQFISETIPDGTSETPGAAFVKTWRLKNIGNCTWTTSYNVVFLNGNAMGAPSAVPLSGNVGPGQQVDIAVNMTAPAAPGNYTGNWSLRNASGVLFGLGSSGGPFWVKIKVAAPTATKTATLTGAPPSSPSTSQVLSQVSIPASGAGNATATCPAGSIVTGGGYAGSPNLLVYSTYASTNGWQAYGQNLTGSPQGLNAYAECLSNSGGTTQQVHTQVTAAASGVGHAVINCPAGSFVTGGGFASNSNLFVYSNSATGNGWEVDAQNTSATDQPLNAYAVCLSGTSGTTQQVVNQVSSAGNDNTQSVKACPAASLLTGGGFAGNQNLFVYNESATGSSWQVYAHNTSGSSQLLNSYAVCLTLP